MKEFIELLKTQSKWESLSPAVRKTTLEQINAIIKKDNRDHGKHEYHCSNCGYRSNDDRIGAMNIQLLGTQYISGQEQPKFELTTNVKRVLSTTR